MRTRILYFGRVQGVGFRWNVSEIVKSYQLTGMVQNLPNGSVEVVLEGSESEIKKASVAIDRKMKGYWTNKEMESKEGEAHFADFSIERRNR
jgi:acylphosphatase